MNLRFICVKCLRALVTLWPALAFAFVIPRMSGDPVQTLSGDEV